MTVGRNPSSTLEFHVILEGSSYIYGRKIIFSLAVLFYQMKVYMYFFSFEGRFRSTVFLSPSLPILQFHYKNTLPAHGPFLFRCLPVMLSTVGRDTEPARYTFDLRYREHKTNGSVLPRVSVPGDP